MGVLLCRDSLPDELKLVWNWIVLTSPEAAAVFLEGWQQAKCPQVCQDQDASVLKHGDHAMVKLPLMLLLQRTGQNCRSGPRDSRCP